MVYGKLSNLVGSVNNKYLRCDPFIFTFIFQSVEDLQKEGKVAVQLIAGKLYFQIKKT